MDKLGLSGAQWGINRVCATQLGRYLDSKWAFPAHRTRPSLHRWRRVRAHGVGTMHIGALNAESAGTLKTGQPMAAPLCPFRHYSSKRRRKRSSIRLVNDPPPPLARRWRDVPGADPE
jgi:hypothetical protein